MSSQEENLREEFLKIIVSIARGLNFSNLIQVFTIFYICRCTFSILFDKFTTFNLITHRLREVCAFVRLYGLRGQLFIAWLFQAHDLICYIQLSWDFCWYQLLAHQSLKLGMQLTILNMPLFTHSMFCVVNKENKRL